MTEQQKKEYADDVASAARIATMCRLLTVHTSGMICQFMEIQRLSNPEDPFASIIDSHLVMDALGVKQPTFSVAINSLINDGLVVEVDSRASGRPPSKVLKNQKFYKLSKSARIMLETIKNLKSKLWLE